MKKYTIAITLPLTIRVELEAENREAALQAAREKAMKEPYGKWEDDLPNLVMDVVNETENDLPVINGYVTAHTDDGRLVYLTFKPEQNKYSVRATPAHASKDSIKKFDISEDDCDLTRTECVKHAARMKVLSLFINDLP